MILTRTVRGKYYYHYLSLQVRQLVFREVQ